MLALFSFFVVTRSVPPSNCTSVGKESRSQECVGRSTGQGSCPLPSLSCPQACASLEVWARDPQKGKPPSSLRLSLVLSAAKEPRGFQV